ncbi:GGDEF domain-containing protein [Mycolicibacterium sp.]|uniref:GGDEF domain-containing protein n=1 Tax=Mycolicibacterium sp. TaxID=2320850 RepID=UPI001A2DE31C|nr:GGDEF domain-containing protein [Mycolicibacterium sp.]MBJ7339211.1 GGDEF domain-containing protein [Mycolicibacterium sp.]
MAVSQGWLLAVNLGSAAMAGVGLLFVVIWVIDRSGASALVFAGAIGCYTVGTIALSLPLQAALASSIHGVLFPVAMLLLADGLLRRVGDRLPRGLLLVYLAVLPVLVWYFAFLSPFLVGRITTQNLGTAMLLATVVHRLWGRAPRSGPDVAAVTATAVLTAALGADVFAALGSTVPHEITTRSELDSYMASNLELFLIVASAVVLPACLITLLAVTVVDMAQELRSQRDRDELTGVLNRRGFKRRGEALLARTERCALVLADLDHFKVVNDTFGHAGGDTVLIAFARILVESAGSGRIIARIGGEEFAALLPHDGVQPAVLWAESARSRLAAHIVELNGVATTVTASFGIAVGDSRAQLTALLDAADKALYKAKLGGRNQIAVGP